MTLNGFTSDEVSKKDVLFVQMVLFCEPLGHYQLGYRRRRDDRSRVDKDESHGQLNSNLSLSCDYPVYLNTYMCQYGSLQLSAFNYLLISHETEVRKIS